MSSSDMMNQGMRNVPINQGIGLHVWWPLPECQSGCLAGVRTPAQVINQTYVNSTRSFLAKVIAVTPKNILTLLVTVCLLPVTTAEDFQYYESYETYMMHFNETCLEDHSNATLKGVHCSVVYENGFCWPPTEAGSIVTMHCQEEIPHSISRKCLEDGFWEFQEYAYVEEECNKYNQINFRLTLSCSLISFVACVIAFIILAVSRSLWCTRNYIHWNLITSFGLKYSVQCILVLLHMTDTYQFIQHGQSAIYILVVYLEMSCFLWMFVEGLYLHTVVALAFRFDIDRIKFVWYCALGWGTPLFFCLIYLITIITNAGAVSEVATQILVVLPIASVLVLNSVFLLNIVRILMSKLRESRGDTQLKHYRRTARATLVLVILLGVTYVFPIFIINLIEGLPDGMIVAIILANTILAGIQGFLVSLIYVFMNSEVKAVLSRRWERFFGFNPCPRRSTDYHAANTTFSRMDDTSMVTTVHSHNDNGSHASGHKAVSSPNTNNNQRPSSGNPQKPLGNGILSAKETKIENLEMSNTSGETSSSPLNGVAKEEFSPLLAGSVIINENGRTLVHDHEDLSAEQIKKGTDV